MGADDVGVPQSNRCLALLPRRSDDGTWACRGPEHGPNCSLAGAALDYLSVRPRGSTSLHKGLHKVIKDDGHSRCSDKQKVYDKEGYGNSSDMRVDLTLRRSRQRMEET